MGSNVRVAVIGVGSMGRHHVRVYSELDGVEVVGIADLSIDACAPLARRYNCPAYSDYRKLLDEQKPDAVSIAVPTAQHLEVACEVAQRGIHMLIEKPIAHTIQHAREIIDICSRNGVVLAVGHVERFNPSVRAVKEKIASGELGRVFHIEARRQGPFPSRVRDIGVAVDLAVHDIDVMRYITGSEVTRVYAEIDNRVHTDHEDSLSAVLRFSKGEVGALAVSWLSPTKMRELLVTGERGMFRVDYLTQDLYFFENAILADYGWETLQILRGVSEGKMVRYALNKKEPLRSELEAFLECMRGGTSSIVSGSDGLEALKIALALVASGRENEAVHLPLFGMSNS
ncbi:MAG: Gfo/Idh/MocA family oxidoreductase [Anaerolineae bacterium]|nr:Gfo/Idh/MocA family oxidoreductase [Candidatus Roseilinea sp.]MDW8451344.1 Gfo/Idh/MocA family oxidoreductase [Anaerolineae bacterium]